MVEAVTVVIPAKNEEKNLPKVLEALSRSVENYQGPVEVLLVDNGSDDATPKIAEALGCRVIVDKTATIAKLRNIGGRMANGEVIAFLDADCIVHENWLSFCVERLRQQNVSIVGTRAVPDRNGSTWVEDGWYRLVSGVERPDFPRWLGTSNLLIRKEVFIELGGFDENLETAEDVDFCVRARERHLICLDKRVCTTHLRESKTLKTLFFRELWRGKSSLRQLMTGRDKRGNLLSVLVPFVNLMLYLSLICCALLHNPVVPYVAAGIAIFPAAMAVRKKALIESRLDVCKVYCVALVYLFARSVSLLKELAVVFRRLYRTA